MMMDGLSLEKCKSFIDCQLAELRTPVPTEDPWERPVVTISRQTGSGGRSIARLLSDILNQRDTESPCAWTVFDKNLVEEVLKEHKMPQELSKFMGEEKGSEIDAAVLELLGLHPSLWTMVHYTTDTILRLARVGKVILVGRGGSVITRSFQNAFHVRVIGSLEKRIAHAAEYYKMDLRAAKDFVHEGDRQRALYLKKYFQEDINNPLLYSLIVNTDDVSYEEAARMIGETILRRKLKTK